MANAPVPGPNYHKYLDVENKQEALERDARSQGISSHEPEGHKKKEHCGLCGTCANATIVTRGTPEHNETEIRCRILDKVMPPDVIDCSSYWKEGQMSLRDMAEIAWYIDTRPEPGGYK